MLRVSNPFPPTCTCVVGTFRIPFLQLGLCKASGTSRSEQCVWERSLGAGRESGIRVLHLTFLSSESVRRVEAGNQPFDPQQSYHPHESQDRDSTFGLGAIKNGAVIFIDLKDTYFQIPIHPNSQPYLYIALNGKEF